MAQNPKSTGPRGFGCEIHNGVELMFFEDFSQLNSIRDVAANESISRIRGYFLDIPQIAGVRQ